MNTSATIVDLCAESMAIARMGYTESAEIILRHAISLRRQQKFERMIDSIAPLLKGERLT